MSNSEVADVIDDAADLIEAHGLWQGSLYGPGGSACMLGALKAQLNNSFTLRDIPEVVREAFQAVSAGASDRYGKGIFRLNDEGMQPGGGFASPERTSMVLDLLRDVAKGLR